MLPTTVPIALNDLHNSKHPHLHVDHWNDVKENPLLNRMSKLVGKYGVHIAFSPDIVINLTGRELINYLEHHSGQASSEGYFSRMLTGQ